ncbi:MAG: PIN domain-containing protein [Verrucomicrobiaceae bacterium]|nr:PIN domain-containing protein [Verrucomicrobiaceae bacterium]
MKHVKAQQEMKTIMVGGRGCVSTQVFGEFFHTVVVRKKIMSPAEAVSAIDRLERGFRVSSIAPALVRDAIAIHQRYQLRYWDSLIIATAKRMQCTEVLSEDMNDGQDYGGVIVRNPFKP